MGRRAAGECTGLRTVSGPRWLVRAVPAATKKRPLERPGLTTGERTGSLHVPVDPGGSANEPTRNSALRERAEIVMQRSVPSPIENDRDLLGRGRRPA